ncbi:MAG: 50S ribosomal protein L23 [Halothiobacillaceae bacterium]|jgi:large subunit ribosomal protein L23|nr:50S ribosomal protein L23 [Halothiobacillaceae bacterium]MDY0049521.1 50S ribosomal protein L23 [Halothiobacillaceae bacterium]
MSAERILQVLRAPVVTEKAAQANTLNQYVFKVSSDANKFEVKKAIESLFSVRVVEVRVLNVKAKVKRFRGLEGSRKGWKKAYVTVAEGQSIEFGAAG